MAEVDVLNVVPRVQYTALATQGTFTYPFVCFQQEDMVVNIDGADLLNTDFTVNGLGVETGGTVTLDTPLSGGQLVTIYRSSVIQRASQYQVAGQLRAATLERDMDVLTTVNQEQARDIDRALKLPVDSPLATLDLPAPVAGQALGWNATEDALENLAVSSLQWRGAWATATVYVINDITKINGSSYICLIDHTSGVFATDLAALRWEVMAAAGASGSGSGDMLKTDNLTGLTNLPLARNNLGFPTNVPNTVLGVNGVGALVFQAPSGGVLETIKTGGGVDYTAGLGLPIIFSLPATPASLTNLFVSFDGVDQFDGFTLPGGANVTFTTGIPALVAKVRIRIVG